MFHHNWIKSTGRVLDSRIRKIWHDRTALGDAPVLLHNYVVELRAPDGELTTLEIEQHDTIDVGIGSEVPLLVSPDGKEAVFDRKDPTINVMAVSKADSAADEERFRGLLDS